MNLKKKQRFFPTPEQSNARGILIITAILALLLLSSILLSFTSMVQREAKMLGALTRLHKASNIAKTGMQLAIVSLSHDGNWADTPSTLYSAVAFDEGSFTVTSSNASQDSITLTSTGQVDDATHTITQILSTDPDPNYPGFLDIDGTNAEMSGRNVDNIFVTNTRLYDPVTIDRIRVSFNQTIWSLQTQVRLKGPSGAWNTVWWGFAFPGTNINVTNTDIPANDTYEMRFKFLPKISEEDPVATVEVYLSDGSVYVEPNIVLDD